MTGRHSGLGWPGAIGDHAREATAPPYIGKHRETFLIPLKPGQVGYRKPKPDPRRCLSCGHLEDRCQCPHDCSYPEDTNA